MTRLAQMYQESGAGFSRFQAASGQRAACQATADVNQYAITPGIQAIPRCNCRRDRPSEVDPEREITVTCGSTEAMIAALRCCEPGHEVIIFERSTELWARYDPFRRDPRFVQLHA
jgi:aminotransferase